MRSFRDVRREFMFWPADVWHTSSKKLRRGFRKCVFINLQMEEEKEMPYDVVL